jgi:hypothetical protein
MAIQTAVGAAHRLPAIVVTIGNFFSAAFSTPWVTFIVVPVVVTLGAMVLKARSRKNFRFESTDYLLGFDLGATACVTLLISGYVLLNQTPRSDAAMLERQSYLFGLFVAFFLFAGFLTFGAYVMHTNGWETAGATECVKKKAIVWINIAGAALLVGAFVLSGGAFT